MLPPPLDSIPRDIVSATDYERYAFERMDENARIYAACGAGEELTLRRNQDSFDRILLNTRVLSRVAGGHTRVNLFGKTFAHPLIIAPMGYQKLFHPDGEVGLARAAEATDSCMVVSTMTSVPPKEIAAAVPGSTRWFQLYFRRDRGFTKSLLERAEASGCEAIVITVDALFTGMRHRLRRVGFKRPLGVDAVLLAGEPATSHPEIKDGQSLVFDGVMPGAPTWHDIRWLRAQTSLPIVIKGVMTPEDAHIALDHGVNAIGVSNHGGRILDSMPSTLEALPAVVAKVGGAAPIFLDGGVRRGTDAFKAIALGATAVMVGRPVLYGLAAAGPLGAAHVLKMLREELEATMALTGCRTLADIGPQVIFKNDR
jgi:4-hydroxymandelate oxidase